MGLLTLRITGLGHSLTLELESNTTTVGALKDHIYHDTGLAPCYQRMLAPRGCKLENDTSTLDEAGLKDQTKLMLLHSALYAQEKDGAEALASIAREIKELSQQLQQQQNSTTDTTRDTTTTEKMESKVVSELVTRICCKLDAVDTMGSETLRAQRKELLQQAERIEQSQHTNHDDDHDNEDSEDKKDTKASC